MTKLLSGLCLLLATNAAFADAEFCDNVSGVAEFNMSVRQTDMPIEEARNLVNMIGMTGRADMLNLRELSKQMLDIAYTMPTYQEEGDKQKASQEFADNYYMSCMQTQV